MWIYLRIDGEGKRRIEVQPETSVGDIKLEVLRLERIPVDHQKIGFKGKELADESTVEDLGIVENTLLHVVLIPRTG
jgi:hypothetical protein